MASPPYIGMTSPTVAVLSPRDVNYIELSHLPHKANSYPTLLKTA